VIPKRAYEVVELAASLGLDFFDLKFEVVPWEVMHEIASYGLPIRAHHWSYGRVYRRLEVHGRMGLSKIYEIVLNNDPAYAFLLDTNTEVENLLIVAHVAAHSDFFKHNVCFTRTQRNMVAEAAEHAARVERYRERYGERPYGRVEKDEVYTLEIGVSVPGYGRVNLEEDIVVTEDGCEFLAPPQRELIVIKP